MDANITIGVGGADSIFNQCLIASLKATGNYSVFDLEIEVENNKLISCRISDCSGIFIVLLKTESDEEWISEAIKVILEKTSEPRIIILSDFSGDIFSKYLRLGVWCNVSLNVSLNKLIEIISAVSEGYCLRETVKVLLQLSERKPMPDILKLLTFRELEVLGFVSDGLSNKEIARKLHIKTCTVKNHIHSVLKKLSVKKRKEASDILSGE